MLIISRSVPKVRIADYFKKYSKGIFFLKTQLFFHSVANFQSPGLYQETNINFLALNYIYMHVFVCLTVFQLCQDGSSWVEPILSKDK